MRKTIAIVLVLICLCFPEKDGETNFNRELKMPYAKVTDGIAVLYENEWRLCTPDD